MPSQTLNAIIDDIGIPDISGIVAFYVSNKSGNNWETDDNNELDIYTNVDLSNVTDINAYFLPNDSQVSLILTTPSSLGENDIIRFYLVPAANLSVFTTGNPINIISLKSSLYNGGDTYVEINSDYMDTPGTLTPITLTETVEPVEITTATLPILSTYTPQQVNSVFDANDSSFRVIKTASEQTIASEVKAYLAANDHMPVFKNYGDYLAYKNAINLQNSLLERYR